MASGVQDQGAQGRATPGVFDVDKLMAAAASNPPQREALLALMDKVCRAALGDMESARRAWQAGQPEESGHVIHALRGSIGTLGAAIFSATSRELEGAVKCGQASEQLFERARRELQQSVDAAQAWLALQPRLAPAAGAGDAVARWKTLLQQRDIDAVVQYQQVRAALAPLGAARAAAIELAMGRLDFAAVLALLGEQP